LQRADRRFDPRMPVPLNVKLHRGLGKPAGMSRRQARVSDDLLEPLLILLAVKPAIE